MLAQKLSENQGLVGVGLSSLRWDTTDPNANMMKGELPTGDATNVPVALFGVGIVGQNLGVLDGQTEPFVGVMNAARDTFGGMTHWSTDDSYTTFYSSDKLRFETNHPNYFFQPADGTSLNCRGIFRATRIGGQCGFELGEPNSSLYYMRYDGSFDQAGLFVTSFCGRAVILADANQRDRDQDIIPQDDPVFVVKRNFNPNTDNAYGMAFSYKGLRGGRVDNADFSSSSFAMENDNPTWDFEAGAVSAYQSAAAITNPNGGRWLTLGGNANLLDTTAGDGGDVVERPGEGNSNGRHGRHHIQRRGLSKYDGSFNYQVEAATTDAAATTILEIPTANDTVVHVQVRVAAIEDDGSNVASYMRVATFKNDGGVLSQIGATTALHTSEDVAGWDVSVAAVGTNVRMQVTGAAATDIQWSLDATTYVTNA